MASAENVVISARLILICPVIALIASILCGQESETFELNLGNELQCVHINWKKTISQKHISKYVCLEKGLK